MGSWGIQEGVRFRVFTGAETPEPHKQLVGDAITGVPVFWGRSGSGQEDALQDVPLEVLPNIALGNDIGYILDSTEGIYFCLVL